ncbi:hypothetical protein D3C81_1000650 [compost metagenome]
MAHGIEHTRQGDVIQVMPRRVGQRPALAPTGHAPVDQLAVAFKADVRAQTKALHDTGAEAFDQDVGAINQLKQHFSGARLARVDGDAASPAPEQTAIGIEKTGHMAVNANDLRAHVRQHHGGERRGTDRIHFHYFHTSQRPRHFIALCFCFKETVHWGQSVEGQ